MVNTNCEDLDLVRCLGALWYPNDVVDLVVELVFGVIWVLGVTASKDVVTNARDLGEVLFRIQPIAAFPRFSGESCVKKNLNHRDMLGR